MWDVFEQYIQLIFDWIWGFNQELKWMSSKNLRIVKNKFWNLVICQTKNFTNWEWIERLTERNREILTQF